MGNFYTLLTNIGINAIIAARASNSEVKLTEIAVGDGDIIPLQDMTALKSEKHRFSINSIIQDIDNPNYLIVEGVIPSNVGGFYVSEVAIYTDQNTLFAIGSLPKTYKPLLEEGSAKDLTIKIFLEITNADSVTLKVDDSVVLATRKFVLSELKKYALINGDETKRFKVADAVELNEAINKKQLEALQKSVNDAISNIQFLPIGTAFGGYEDDNPNFIVAFGGTFKKADYPKLWTYASTHPNRLKTLAQWNAEATANSGICDYYCEVDSLNFRVPSLDGAFVRFSSRTVGTYQADVLKKHKHKYKAGSPNAVSGSESFNATTWSGGFFETQENLDGGGETNPKNIAQKPLIVAK